MAVEPLELELQIADCSKSVLKLFHLSVVAAKLFVAKDLERGAQPPSRYSRVVDGSPRWLVAQVGLLPANVAQTSGQQLHARL